MSMKFCLDRFEGEVAVCLCESEAATPQYEFSLTDTPALRALSEGALFEAELDELGRPCHIRELSEEAASRRDANRARLRALFDKSKR